MFAVIAAVIAIAIAIAAVSVMSPSPPLSPLLSMQPSHTQPSPLTPATTAVIEPEQLFMPSVCNVP